MAIILMEGFDHSSNPAEKGWGGGFFGYTGGRFGGQGVRIQPGYHTFPSAQTIIAGVAYLPVAATTDSHQITLYSGGTIAASVQIASANGAFRVVNAAGTVLCSGTRVIAGSVWVYVELKVFANTSTGTVELWVNGTLECSATGKNTGSGAIDQVYFSGLNNTYVDDVYVADTSGSAPTNDILGDVRIETLWPTGNGTNTAWTGSYTDWDDTTANNGDTDYVSSSTPGDKETSAMGNLSVASGTVFAVQTNLVARKDDAGVRTIAPVLRVGGTDYDGTTTPGLSSSYVNFKQIYDRLDPSGAAWSISTVNALEAGVKEIA